MVLLQLGAATSYAWTKEQRANATAEVAAAATWRRYQLCMDQRTKS